MRRLQFEPTITGLSGKIHTHLTTAPSTWFRDHIQMVIYRWFTDKKYSQGCQIWKQKSVLRAGLLYVHSTEWGELTGAMLLWYFDRSVPLPILYLLTKKNWTLKVNPQKSVFHRHVVENHHVTIRFAINDCSLAPNKNWNLGWKDWWLVLLFYDWYLLCAVMFCFVQFMCCLLTNITQHFYRSLATSMEQ